MTVQHDNLPGGMPEWKPEDTWGLFVILMGLWTMIAVLGGVALTLAVT